MTNNSRVSVNHGAAKVLEGMVQVVRYPASTDETTGSIGHCRVAVGPGGETIQILTQSIRERTWGTFFTRFLGNAFFASSSEELIVPWQDALKRSIRRFQDGTREPRGTVPVVPLVCVAYDFIPVRAAYISTFNFNCAPGAAPLGCRYEVRHWNGGWWFDTNGQFDLEDRTKRRLITALLEKLEADAYDEDDERERAESERIREYRQAVARGEVTGLNGERGRGGTWHGRKRRSGGAMQAE